MKKIIFIIALPILILTQFSCSAPAYVEKASGTDFSEYKTYKWVNTCEKQSKEDERSISFADVPVHNAVEAELNKWGWEETTSEPDAYIMYDIMVENTTELQKEAQYSRPYTRYYYNPYRKRWYSINYPSQFLGYTAYETPVKEGTITITIVDAKTDKKIWQGWTTEKLDYAGISNTEIKRSIRNIFDEEA
ncbi:MAG TPA: DUF4136 domain-containing protein [Chitinophagaceae bacterium]|nr:DUF4136 domain-containing protein [Chitinophagaceae bacterium]